MLGRTALLTLKGINQHTRQQHGQGQLQPTSLAPLLTEACTMASSAALSCVSSSSWQTLTRMLARLRATGVRGLGGSALLPRPSASSSRCTQPRVPTLPTAQHPAASSLGQSSSSSALPNCMRRGPTPSLLLPQGLRRSLQLQLQVQFPAHRPALRSTPTRLLRCYITTSLEHGGPGGPSQPRFRLLLGQARSLEQQVRHIRWQASQEYLRYVNRVLSGTVAPYWPCLTWASACAFIRESASAWVPSLGHTLPQYILTQILNAVNLISPYLPRTVFLTAVELARSSQYSTSAQAFEYFVDVADVAPEVIPWYRTLASELRHSLVNLVRLLWLALLFTPVVFTAPLAMSFNFRREEWLELLRKTLEAAGPAFIKWGQWAATRHDLFPPDMCSELEHLHTQAPGHKFKHTRRAVEEAFGLSVETLFESFETKPVASGSIGQIHRARLSDMGAQITGMKPGTVVAVKVRHPGVDTAISRDFATMMYVAGLASRLPALQHLRLEDTLKQFAAPLKEQVDLSREASHLHRFNFNFRKTPDVMFPVPLFPLVSSDVLVETFEEGDHITDYLKTENPYNQRLSKLGSGTMLQMMLIDNLIHSDLHPGNILVRLEPPGGLLGAIYSTLDAVKRHADKVPSLFRPSKGDLARIDTLQQRWLQPRIVLLDVGMATELTHEDQANMVGLFRSFAALDGRACGEWTLRFSGCQQQCPDPEAFKSAMESTFDTIRRTDEEGGWAATQFRNSAEALASVLELVRLYKVSLPGHICAVVVTTLVLEGWSNKLDPEHSVLTTVQTMFEGDNSAWAQRMDRLVDMAMNDEEANLALMDI